MLVCDIDDIDFEEVMKNIHRHKVEHGLVADALALCGYHIDYKLVDEVGIVLDKLGVISYHNGRYK